MAGVDVRISELPAATEGHPDDRFETTQVDGASLVSRSITLEQVSDAVAATLPPPAADWADITGKPATFPPTLPIPESGVTNLVSDLAGKAPVSHTHTAGDLPPYPTSLPPSGAAGGALAGTYPNPTLVGGPLSNYALTSSIPTTLPPSGTAGGDLAGTYPNPTIKPGTNTQVLTTTGGVAVWATPAGGGSVTSVSVVNANGLAGTVATPTVTPAITLSTTVTGMLKGNATAISAATAGTDYMTPGNVSAAYQPLDADLTALAGLNATAGLVEQTAAAAFTKRLIGVTNTTDIPTRAQADARYAPIAVGQMLSCLMTAGGIPGTVWSGDLAFTVISNDTGVTPTGTSWTAPAGRWRLSYTVTIQCTTAGSNINSGLYVNGTLANYTSGRQYVNGEWQSLSVDVTADFSGSQAISWRTFTDTGGTIVNTGGTQSWWTATKVK